MLDLTTNPGTKPLTTRRGTYRVAHYDLWRDRASSRSVVDALYPNARVCVLGSCFGEQLVRHLGTRGYRTSWHPAGELYNPASIATDLDHTLGDEPWPAHSAVAVPGGYVHRFRKRCEADTEAELLRVDAEHTTALRESLTSADVVLVLVGTTTEVWRERGSGIPSNEIPHPAVFSHDGWVLDPGALDTTSEDVRRIRDRLLRHTTATVVLAVCPIPLNATWSADPVTVANGRVKSTLRMAIEALDIDSRSAYLDLWDWVQAQTSWWTPMTTDGRHISEVGAAVMTTLIEQRLGVVRARTPIAGVARSVVTDARLVVHKRRLRARRRKRPTVPTRV